MVIISDDEEDDGEFHKAVEQSIKNSNQSVSVSSELESTRSSEDEDLEEAIKLSLSSYNGANTEPSHGNACLPYIC